MVLITWYNCSAEKTNEGSVYGTLGLDADGNGDVWPTGITCSLSSWPASAAPPGFLFTPLSLSARPVFLSRCCRKVHPKRERGGGVVRVRRRGRTAARVSAHEEKTKNKKTLFKFLNFTNRTCSWLRPHRWSHRAPPTGDDTKWMKCSEVKHVK